MGSINSQGVYEYDVTDNEIGPVLLNRQSAALTNLFQGRANTVRVANVSQRASALAAHGTPSTSNPLIVFRADAGAGRELEYTTNGTTWRTIPAEPSTGWVTPISATGTAVWSASGGTTSTNPRAVRIGDVATVELNVSNVNLSSGTQNTTIGTVAAPFRPTTFRPWAATTASVAVQGLVSSAGAVSVRWASTSGSGTTIYFTGSWICNPL